MGCLKSRFQKNKNTPPFLKKGKRVMVENPNYYAVITADVRYDKRLTPNAKLLFAEITALCNMNGKCFATNRYFADLYGVSVVSISKWIRQLVDYGYINSEIIYKEDTKEIDNRYLSLVKHPIKEIFNTPIKENLKDNNIRINNNLTDSNKYFDEFWKLYTPIKDSYGNFVGKGNKQSCMKKFDKLLGEGVKYETIIRGLEQYLKYCRKNGWKSCGAEVFLNQRRFENDYSDSQCIDSQRQPDRKRPVSLVEIANELTRESKYDESDSIPF